VGFHEAPEGRQDAQGGILSFRGGPGRARPFPERRPGNSETALPPRDAARWNSATVPPTARQIPGFVFSTRTNCDMAPRDAASPLGVGCRLPRITTLLPRVACRTPRIATPLLRVAPCSLGIATGFPRVASSLGRVATGPSRRATRNPREPCGNPPGCISELGERLADHVVAAQFALEEAAPHLGAEVLHLPQHGLRGRAFGDDGECLAADPAQEVERCG
jgi:hypothetical protein